MACSPTIAVWGRGSVFIFLLMGDMFYRGEEIQPAILSTQLSNMSQRETRWDHHLKADMEDSQTVDLVTSGYYKPAYWLELEVILHLIQVCIIQWTGDVSTSTGDHYWLIDWVRKARVVCLSYWKCLHLPWMKGVNGWHCFISELIDKGKGTDRSSHGLIFLGLISELKVSQWRRWIIMSIGPAGSNINWSQATIVCRN